MKDKITLGELDKAVSERLSEYRKETGERIFGVTERTMKTFKQITRQTAPRERLRSKKGRRPGTFAKNIDTVTESRGIRGAVGTWYVKGSDYRLTHLLVNGHQNRDGSRTPGDPFLENAVEKIAEDYINGIERALTEND